MTTDKRNGFTLIELSIVLVIIGLIIGGILVGQDMIKAATVRAQITQLQKFNTAVRTFQTKYGDLPGDMPSGPAASFGFYTNYTAACPGNYIRNGDGLIDSSWAEGLWGENNLAWLDLSMAGLIDQSFSVAPWTAQGLVPCSDPLLPIPNQIFPDAKLQGNSVVFIADTSSNWLVVETPGLFEVLVNGFTPPYWAISVSDANALDSKIDDGKPTTGNVRAELYGGVSLGGWPALDPDLSASSDNGTTGVGTPACWNSTTKSYATSYQGGTSLACLLSVKLQ